MFFNDGELSGSNNGHFGTNSWVLNLGRECSHLHLLKTPRRALSISRKVSHNGEVTCLVLISMPFWQLGVQHTDDFHLLPIPASWIQE